MNKVLKKGTFCSNGNDFAYVVSDADNTVWIRLGDICKAIGIKYWCVPSNKDCVLNKPFASSVRKIMFSKTYAIGIKDQDAMEMLTYFANNDDLRAEKASSVKKVVKNFLYREKKKIDDILNDEARDNKEETCELSTINNTSSEAMLKEYFIKVKEFSNSTEKFPIDLDEIWGLSFTTKSNAIKFIKREFTENTDYQVFIQNISAKVGASRCHKYMLSVPCMEFIIAKANRYVFEIYRKVFHEVTNSDLTLKADYGNFPVPQKFSEALLLAAHMQQTIEEQQQKIGLDAPKVEYYDDMVENREYFTTTTIATELHTTPQTLNKLLIKKHIITGTPGCYKADESCKEFLAESPFPNLIRWNKEGREYIHALWNTKDQIV